MGFKVDTFNIHDLIKMLQQLQAPRKRIIGEVLLLGKILIVIPARNAVSERPFLDLRRIKTHLRPSITINRLDHILHVHLDKIHDS